MYRAFLLPSHIARFFGSLGDVPSHCVNMYMCWDGISSRDILQLQEAPARDIYCPVTRLLVGLSVLLMVYRPIYGVTDPLVGY
jgi:hypothetical protein